MEWVANGCSCLAESAEASPVFAVRDLNFATTTVQSVLKRCPQCGALFPEVVPTPGTLIEAYRNYYTAPRKRSIWLGVIRRLLDRSRLSYLDRLTPRRAGRILDYGCGAGDYLARLVETRPSVAAFGTDLTEAPPAPLAFKWVDVSDIESCGLFDWITLSHVVEHVDQPAQVLARLVQVLAPHGGIWIATPNAESYLFGAAGRWARDVDFPRHREVFSANGIGLLLSGAGLEFEFNPAPRLNAVLNTISTLKNIINDREARRAERLRSVLATLVATTIHLLSPASRRRVSSPEIITVCRRSGRVEPMGYIGPAKHAEGVASTNS